jgi:hypothetical protein
MGVLEVNATKTAGEIKQQTIISEGPSQDLSSTATAFALSPRLIVSIPNLDCEHREFTEVPQLPTVAALRLFEQTTFAAYAKACFLLSFTAVISVQTVSLTSVELVSVMAPLVTPPHIHFES